MYHFPLFSIGCHIKRNKYAAGMRLGGCAALLGVFFVVACTIIPPASIQYLKSLPQGALQNAKAKNVRLAINLPRVVTMTDIVAHITGESKGDKVSAQLPFSQVSDAGALSPPPTGGSPKSTWSYYELTPKGQKGFKQIQSFVGRHPLGSGPTTITIKLHKKLRLTQCDIKGKVLLKAAILLDPDRGYVVVWDRDTSLADLASSENQICTSSSG